MFSSVGGSFIYSLSNNYSVICMDPIHEAGNKRSLRYASMISNNITNYWTYNVGVVSWLSVIRGSFAQSWEHEACPLSGIKKVCSWEVAFR